MSIRRLLILAGNTIHPGPWLPSSPLFENDLKDTSLFATSLTHVSLARRLVTRTWALPANAHGVGHNCRRDQCCHRILDSSGAACLSRPLRFKPAFYGNLASLDRLTSTLVWWVMIYIHSRRACSRCGTAVACTSFRIVSAFGASCTRVSESLRMSSRQHFLQHGKISELQLPYFGHPCAILPPHRAFSCPIGLQRSNDPTFALSRRYGCVDLTRK